MRPLPAKGLVTLLSGSAFTKSHVRQILYVLVIVGLAIVEVYVARGQEPNPKSRSSHSGIVDRSHSPKYRSDRVLVRFKPGVPRYAMENAHAGIGSRVLSEPVIVDRLQLVQLAQGTGIEEALRSYRQNPNVLYAEPDYIVHSFVTPNDPQFRAQWMSSNRDKGKVSGPEGSCVPKMQVGGDALASPRKRPGDTAGHPVQ